MAEDRLTIDEATLFDNVDGRQVEFSAEVGGERYDFAVQYGVLEALGAEFPVTQASASFRRYADRIETLGTRALARDTDAELVVISENDLG